MADDTPKEERRFEPTQRRRDEFRREGRVAVSRDLASAGQLVAVLFGFLIFGNTLMTAVYATLTWVFQHVGDGGGEGLQLADVIVVSLESIAIPTLILCAFFAAATVVAYFAQTRMMFSAKAIGFKLDRLNAFRKLGELFGPKKASIRVGLAVAKVALTGLVLALALAEVMPAITRIPLGSLAGADQFVRGELRYLLILTLIILVILAVLDYIWQRSQLNEQMRMTREEIKKESEDEEGKPEIRARRRQRHRELSMNRILDSVPEADVIVTNPTHFAVALRYRPGEDKAPVVTAKGADDLAAHIRALARRHGVPIMENKPVARALFAKVRVGQPVPANLFTAVAKILANVYKIRRKAGHTAPAG